MKSSVSDEVGIELHDELDQSNNNDDTTDRLNSGETQNLIRPTLEEVKQQEQIAAGNGDEQDFAHDLTKHFSLTNAKLVALGLVTFFILYHGYLNIFYGKT